MGSYCSLEKSQWPIKPLLLGYDLSCSNLELHILLELLEAREPNITTTFTTSAQAGSAS